MAIFGPLHEIWVLFAIIYFKNCIMSWWRGCKYGEGIRCFVSVLKCKTKTFRKHNFDLFYSLVHSLGSMKQFFALNLSLANIYKTAC